MPWIIDYPTVLDRLSADGLVCVYPNGGAFGFPKNIETQIRGWIGPPDATIKPAAWPNTRRVAEPYEQTLVGLAALAWEKYLPGRIWVMPASHWSFELTHGSRDWLPAVIENLELDPGLLAGRINASAIEFAPTESRQFKHLIQRLLEMLQASDFVLAFPRHKTICTLHHHKQLWWVTTDARVIEGLDNLVAAESP